MKISNSQIMDAQKCEKRFYFAHILKLRPKSYPAPMERGIFGHALLQAFFEMMATGATFEECVEATHPLILAEQNHDNLAIYRHVLAFGNRAFEEGWEVISCEVNYLYPLFEDDGGDGGLNFAFTPDIVFRWTKGPRRGNYFMLDFKFTAQEWNDREIAVYQQVPKYAVYWNLMNPDKKIHNLGVVNLLTRAAVAAPGNKLFVVKWLKVTTEKMDNIERENNRLVQRVAHMKKNYQPEDYLRTVDSYQCKLCFFGEDICPADLEGRSIEKYIKVNYEINTYFEENYGVDA